MRKSGPLDCFHSCSTLRSWLEKFDRRRQIETCALDILKMSMEPKPPSMPRFIWAYVVGLVFYK